MPPADSCSWAANRLAARVQLNPVVDPKLNGLYPHAIVQGDGSFPLTTYKTHDGAAGKLCANGHLAAPAAPQSRRRPRPFPGVLRRSQAAGRVGSDQRRRKRLGNNPPEIASRQRVLAKLRILAILYRRRHIDRVPLGHKQPCAGVRR